MATPIVPLASLNETITKGLTGVFCDIDDTLTVDGKLIPSAFSALDAARNAGLRVVPITGRPAGWADQIARMWPVDGVIGENGGLWYYMHNGTMHRRYLQDPATRLTNRKRLKILGQEILKTVAGSALASDQPYRDLDLAIDFCEDVPRLSDQSIQRIVELFLEAGATCKISSIHVNGWYGQFDKLEGCRQFLKERYNEDLDTSIGRYIFVGDSANDEPMFEAFPHSIGVANVSDFLDQMSAHPKYICKRKGGYGFTDIIHHILKHRGNS